MCWVGLCYRTLGRLHDAEVQFQVALQLNSDLLSAQFNLGLVYQQQTQYDKAVDMFQNVSRYYPVLQDTLTVDTVLDCKVRECDSLQVLHRHQEALQCWKEGMQRFPNASVFYHELADLQAQVRSSSFSYPLPSLLA